MRGKRENMIVFIAALVVGYAAGPANADLVGHWMLDETSGTTVEDSSGKRHDGELLGGLSFENDSVEGMVGKALHFDGTEGRIIRVDSISLPVRAFTIALWFKPDSDSNSSSSRANIMFWGGTANSTEGDKPYLTFNKAKTGEICLYVSIVGKKQKYLQTTTTSWKASTWHHIAVTFDGTDFKIYVNGVLESTDRHPGTHFASSKAFFGAKWNGRTPFAGKLDDIRIYDSALSPDDISELISPDPALEELITDVKDVEAVTQQEPKKAIAFLEKKIAESERWRKKNPHKHLSRFKELFFDLHFLLAQAKKAAGLPKSDAEATYRRAFEHGTPSLSDWACVLLWLHEDQNMEEFERVVLSLNDNNTDYLKEVAAKAQEMVLKGKSKAAIGLLEANLAAYAHWCEKHPDNDAVAEHTLPEVYFQLAKAKESAGAPKKDIADAYGETFASSPLDWVPEQTAALTWLLENDRSKVYEEVIKSLTPGRKTENPLASIVCNMCKDLESKRDWANFERLLDTLFAKAKYPFEWAVLVESCLDDKTNRWAKAYYEYAESKPRLEFDKDRAAAERYTAEEKHKKATELYRDLVKRCGPEDSKEELEFQICKGLFLAGEYREAASALESFTVRNKVSDRGLVRDAMLVKGRAYMHLGELDRAVDHFFTMTTERPEAKEAAEANFFLGYCYMLQDNFEAALEAFDCAVKSYPAGLYGSKARMCMRRIKIEYDGIKKTAK